MTWNMGSIRIAVTLVAIAVSTLASAQLAPSEDQFPPFEQWKSAVLSGDAAALKELYQSDPPAKVDIDGTIHGADDDVSFWIGLKPHSMKVETVRNVVRHGHVSYIFRAEIASESGKTLTITDDQSWLQKDGTWRLISVERTDAPHLKQPSDMKKNIYPADADAHAEIKEAQEKAAAAHKRLLLVFGANWCFDCHVLDLAFHRPDLAPVLVANYEVVHIDLGEEEEKNSDLVHKYEIPLNKGVPALAVAESDGKLVVSQKNGEFEDARGLTPEVLLEFLNKWKPQAGN